MRKNKLELWNCWAAIASSIAAVISLLLFGYQLWTDRPDFKINLRGSAFADYQEQKTAFISVWLDVLNQGRRPAGLIEAKLLIKFPDSSRLEVEEIPLFPRFQVNNQSNAPAVESPFFYEPSFFDNFVKDKSGKAIPFDYRPKTLERKERIFDTGIYHRGYLVFKLETNNREKFLQAPDRNALYLVLFTTNNTKKVIRIRKINKWKPETFGKRFFVITPDHVSEIKEETDNQ
jgi:hypothetical protein